LKQTSDSSAYFAIPAAIVVGLAMAPRPVDQNYLIPVFDAFAILRENGILDFLKIVIAASFLRFGMTSWLIVLSIFEILSLWMAMYSAVGAFFPQTAISGLILLSAFTIDREQIRSFSAKAFSLIFFLAAAQKVNSSYLTGAEFTSPNGFASIAIYYWGPLPEYLAVNMLPWLSILGEVALAIGLLWRPTLFAHAATVFVLLLAFVHPPVLYVYFTALFFLALIDTTFNAKISTGKLAASATSPFLWATASGVVAFLPAVSSQNGLSYFLRTWPIAAILVLIHFKMALIAMSDKEDRSAWWKIADLDLRTSFAPKTVLLALVGTFFVYRAGLAPTPIGFSMFSGSNQNAPSYDLEIEDRLACNKISRRLVAFDFSDVSFAETESGCKLTAPTKSGRASAIRQFCRDNPQLKFREDELEGRCPSN
jgi:hypothetical protein